LALGNHFGNHFGRKHRRQFFLIRFGCDLSLDQKMPGKVIESCAWWFSS